MLRKQVVLLTSVTLLVALITNIAGWIQNAEAHPSIVTKVYVTHYCVDETTTRPQNDICKSTEYSYYSYFWPSKNHPKKKSDPDHTSHGAIYDEVEKSKFEYVDSCSQCSF